MRVQTVIKKHALTLHCLQDSTTVTTHFPSDLPPAYFITSSPHKILPLGGTQNTPQSKAANKVHRRISRTQTPSSPISTLPIEMKVKGSPMRAIHHILTLNQQKAILQDFKRQNGYIYDSSNSASPSKRNSQRCIEALKYNSEQILRILKDTPRRRGGSHEERGSSNKGRATRRAWSTEPHNSLLSKNMHLFNSHRVHERKKDRIRSMRSRQEPLCNELEIQKVQLECKQVPECRQGREVLIQIKSLDCTEPVEQFRHSKYSVPMRKRHKSPRREEVAHQLTPWHFEEEQF